MLHFMYYSGKTSNRKRLGVRILVGTHLSRLKTDSDKSTDKTSAIGVNVTGHRKLQL